MGEPGPSRAWPAPTGRSAGFTLVELIMVIVLAGVVAVMISSVLSNPMQGFVDQSRRAELVDKAAIALNLMSRDIRLAVPNSVRVSADGQAVELLRIHSAARHLTNRVGEEGLRFSTGAASSCTTEGERCDRVDVLDVLDVLDPQLHPEVCDVCPDRSGCSGLPVRVPTWMVLYSVGAESGGNPLPGSNVWAPANPGVITPTGTDFTLQCGAPDGVRHVTLDKLPPGGFRFAFASPQRRLYLAESVVGYRCEGGQLLRYSYNQLLNVLPASPPGGSDPQPVVDRVSSCQLTYSPGSTQRAGLFSIAISLSDGGESIRLFQQVHVDNAP